MTNDESIAAARKLAEEDRQVAIEIIAVELGISPRATHTVPSEKLDLIKLSARWMPKALCDGRQIQKIFSAKQRGEGWFHAAISSEWRNMGLYVCMTHKTKFGQSSTFREEHRGWLSPWQRCSCQSQKDYCNSFLVFARYRLSVFPGWAKDNYCSVQWTCSPKSVS